MVADVTFRTEPSARKPALSGLAVMYRAQGRPPTPEVLDGMLEAMRHRGGDAGRHLEGVIGFAYDQGAIRPESTDESPWSPHESADMRLAWDGRLDNHQELMAALGREHPSPRSDASLALAAYRRWGAGCFAKLLGDFALVVWDRSSRRLVCARDRMGGRPLHYTWNGRDLFVSSEIKPLLRARDMMPEPDDAMILAFLLGEFNENHQARTFFEGIHRLPPGHLLRLEDGRLRVEPFAAIGLTGETRYRRDEEYVQHFGALFREAVRCRTRSAWPLGARLSGGLDSAAIVCTAARVLDDPGQDRPRLEAFTVFTEDPASDERRYVRAVTEAIGVKLHEIQVSETDALGGLGALLRQLESPIVSPQWPSGRTLMTAVRDAGCRVLLTGDGGDELLDEIGCLTDRLRSGRLVRFVRDTRAFAQWYGVDPKEFRELALAQLLSPRLRSWVKRVVRGRRPSWISRDLVRRVGREGLRGPRCQPSFSSYAQAHTYRSVTSAYYLLKRELDDRFTSAFGTEIWYPFLDSRLVDFVLSIPSERHSRNGERKGMLRQWTTGVVPDLVRTRRGKGDWTGVVNRCVSTLCRRDPSGVIANRSGRMARYIDPRGVERLVARYLAGAREMGSDLWFLLTLDHWLAEFWGRAS